MEIPASTNQLSFALAITQRCHNTATMIAIAPIVNAPISIATPPPDSHIIAISSHEPPASPNADVLILLLQQPAWQENHESLISLRLLNRASGSDTCARREVGRRLNTSRFGDARAVGGNPHGSPGKLNAGVPSLGNMAVSKSLWLDRCRKFEHRRGTRGPLFGLGDGLGKPPEAGRTFLAIAGCQTVFKPPQSDMIAPRAGSRAGVCSPAVSRSHVFRREFL